MRLAVSFGALIALAACTATDGGPAPDATPPTPEPETSAAPAVTAHEAEGADEVLEWSVFVPRAAMAIPRLGPGLVAEAEAAVADYRAQAADARDNPATPFQTWTLDLEWSVAFENDLVLSLEGRRDEYSGGAHPVSGYDSALWDRSTQRRLTLADLFADRRDRGPGLTAVSDAAFEAYRAEVARKTGGEPDEYWEVNAIEVLQPTDEAFEHFVLVPSDQPGKAAAVELLFGPYILGAYAEGDYRLRIPAEVFAPYLAGRFDGLFAVEGAGG
jgi:hypothetical protein